MASVEHPAVAPRVSAELRRLEIREVLHFTTNIGLAGILADREVLCRLRLPVEKHLATVYPPNARHRYDKAWLDYVNLSISRINLRYYDASERWHADEQRWWCVLGFDPMICAHPGVYFASTNNRYSGCRRVEGVEGLRRLWAGDVFQYEDHRGEHWARRTADHQRHWPTCRQAEVLYPYGVATAWLRTIYVVNDLHADIAGVAIGLLQHPPVDVLVRPDVFV